MNIVKLLGKVMVIVSIALTAALAQAAPVNINTADAATLSKNINGVGPKKADAIVAYRKAKGPFKSVEELVKVKGIGKKLIEKNRADLFISDANSNGKDKKAVRN